MKTILMKVLAFLAVIGDIPGTTIDDTLREILGWLVGQADDAPIIAYLEAKADIPADALTVETEPPAEVAEALAAQNIEWGNFAKLLPFILQLINLFRGQ